MKRVLFILFVLCLFVVKPAYAETSFKVLKVVDGDTIVVDVRGNKETVRLLGIDTPESVDPRKPVQCFAKEATNKMSSLVYGKSVILVDDKTQGNRDKYKRLLRYAYLPDSVRTFVNGEMVKQGYAFSYKQYPTKMLNKFNLLEKNARDKNLGLWGSCPSNASPTKGIIQNTPKSIVPTNSYVAPTQTSGSSGGFTCSGKTLCGQMNSCAEARFYLTSCGVSRLDGDSDGIPCETICN